MNNLPTIYGFNKTSDAGPDVLAYSIFLGGCNLRCPYCMNSKLVTSIEKVYPIDFDTIKKSIVENNIQWLIISGGEVLLNKIDYLINLICEIRNLGCKVGISTNGIFYSKLMVILDKINYVALDIKGNRDVYSQISDDKYAYENVLISKRLLLDEKNNRSDFDYEIRFTMYPLFMKDSFDDLLSLIDKDEKLVLQPYRNAKNMLESHCQNIVPFSNDELNVYLAKTNAFTKNSFIRYV